MCPPLYRTKKGNRLLKRANAPWRNGTRGGALLDTLPYKDWLRLILGNQRRDIVRPDWMAASTFFVVRQSDQRMVGMVDIRHSLNHFLATYGGHIGYGVRPTERRKGYATQILELALDYGKTIPLSRVMLACNQENEGARRTIVKCGRILEREWIHTNGKNVQAYWISIA